MSDESRMGRTSEQEAAADQKQRKLPGTDFWEEEHDEARKREGAGALGVEEHGHASEAEMGEPEAVAQAIGQEEPDRTIEEQDRRAGLAQE